MSLIKILDRTGPRMDPFCTPLRMASKSLLILPNLQTVFCLLNNFGYILNLSPKLDVGDIFAWDNVLYTNAYEYMICVIEALGRI